MPKYFQNPSRTSHTISRGNSMRNVPRTNHRRPNGKRPAPIAGKGLRRCASCGRR